MQRLKTPSIVLSAAILAAFCFSASGQSKRQYEPASPPPEKLVVDKGHPAPFATDGDSGRAQAIEFRAADQMTARDREVAANAESSIAENTHYANLEFNQGTWTYDQVICPALPEHVFLRFLRNDGVGDTSMFTASIPRGGEGQVRIIPIRLRGYSLFSPAPINAMTVAAFNKIRAEENPDQAPVSAWLGVGLCYAALAGGHPQLPALQETVQKNGSVALNTGILEVSDGGGAVIDFNDISLPGRVMNWELSFDRNGKLLKASHSAAQPIRVIGVTPASVNPAGRTVSPSNPPQQSRAVPPAPAAVPVHPVPPPQTGGVKTVPAPSAN